MIEQVVRLVYPTSLRNFPIINRLIRSFDSLSVNILRAEVNDREGWLECQFVGKAAVIEGAIDWLRGQGIEVQTLGA